MEFSGPENKRRDQEPRNLEATWLTDAFCTECGKSIEDAPDARGLAATP